LESVTYKDNDYLHDSIAIFSFLFLVSLQRAPSLPISRPPSSSRSRLPSPPVTSAGFGKRPAPGVSFIKAKQKRKQANLVKDFIFSSVDEEGQMVMLFQISINFITEVLERFGQLSVSIVGSAIEQELRDQGEIVRLVIVDARGQPIMDSSQTRSRSLYNLYELCFLLLPWLNVFLLLFPKKHQPLKRDLLFA